MKIRTRPLLPKAVRHVGLTVAALALAATSAFAYPNLTNVVELNGDNEPTDTIPAKWTGVTYNTTVTGEPVPGVPAGTPFTVPRFGEDVPSSVDRAHGWNGARADLPIPGYLLEGEYIMVGTDNRNNTNFMLQLFVAERSAVYLLLDNRCGDAESGGGTSSGNPPFLGLPLDQWTVMQWVYTNGFQPVLRGYNRAGDANAPDEVAWDEGSNGDLNQWGSVYYKIVNPGAPGVPAVITGDQYIGNNIYGVVVTPEVPKRPNVQAASMNGRVILSWAASAGTMNYVIRRSDVNGGPYTDIAAQTTPGYTDLSVVNGQTYYYVVAAEGLFGTNVSLQVIGAPKLAPENLVATGGTNQIALSWTALGGASSYTVKRADASGGPFANIASGITATSYVDTSLPGGRQFYYIVSAALSGGGESANSDEAGALTAPTVPSSLVAERFAATVIRLSWNTTDPVPPNVLIEKSSNGTTFTPVAEVTDGSKRYFDVGLGPNATNYYRIRASNSTGFSGYTAVVSASTPSGGVNVNFGVNYTSSPEYPIPGYLDDYGDAYGDRGNGYSYGWDADLTGSGRWAKLASSPDLRYDTMIFAYLPDPPVHVWEIELTNGLYQVHIVSGDPNSEASVYQWEVEGNVSEAKTPTVGARWQDFHLTVNVQDGRMTFTNGPSASNNKICFVDIYPTVATLNIIPGTLKVADGTVTFNLQTVPGVNNIVEYKNALTDPSWTTLTSFTGSGAIVPITDSGPLPAGRFYRARAVIP